MVQTNSFRNKLNDVFGTIFFLQLFVTTLEVCSATYLLATFSVTSAKFWSMILSLSFIMTEIYVFCWHGNLVMEKVILIFKITILNGKK